MLQPREDIMNSVWLYKVTHAMAEAREEVILHQRMDRVQEATWRGTVSRWVSRAGGPGKRGECHSREIA